MGSAVPEIPGSACCPERGLGLGWDTVRSSPKELRRLVLLYNQAVSGLGTGGEAEGKEIQNSETSRQRCKICKTRD